MRKPGLHWLFLLAVLPVLVGLVSVYIVLYRRELADIRNDIRRSVDSMREMVDSGILNARAAGPLLLAPASGFDHVLNSRHLPDGWCAAVFDGRGTLIWQRNHANDRLGPAILPALRERMRTSASGFYEEARGIDGSPLTVAYARSESTGYVVSIGIPSALLSAHMRDDLAAPLAGVAGAVLLSLLLIWRLGQSMTQRRDAEVLARAEQQRLYRILETLPAYVALIGPDHRIAFANRVFGEFFGEPEGRRCHEAIFKQDKPCGRCNALTEDNPKEWEQSASNGHCYLTQVRRITDAQGKPMILEMGIDTTERRQIEAALMESESRLRLLIASVTDYAIFMIDTSGRIASWNVGARRLNGYDAAEILGRPLECLHSPEDAAAGTPRRLLELAAGAGGCSDEGERVRKDGSRFLAHVAMTAMHGANGKLLGFATVIHDITDRKRAELAQDRLTRALKLVSDCNSALVHAKEEHALLDAVCRLVVETGGYLMAWIGFAENDADKTVRPVARFGHEAGYLSGTRVSWGDGELGGGPTGTAIRTKKTQVSQNCADNPHMAPWREAALERGYRSSAALPLASGEAVLGALSIYAMETESFSADEIRLLEQLANDLAFGIAAMRAEGARREAIARQQEMELRYRRVLDNAADAVFIVAPDAQYVYANQEAERLLDYGNDELLAMGIADVVPPNEAEAALSLFRDCLEQEHGRMRAEMYLRRRDGSLVPVELTTVRLPDGNLYGACRDISERKNYEAQLEHRATHDPLTGLANRNLLADRIEQSAAHARRFERSVAVMLLDLDRFKVINDSLGHGVGDILLQRVAKRLVSSVRAGDTVARLGGDEFMVIMSDVAAEDDVSGLARKVLDIVTHPMTVDGHSLVTTASLGISLFPRDGRSAGELIKNADVAMYRAKEMGRNRFQFYAPEMNARMLERLKLEGGLRTALANQEFELHYQPKVDVRTGAVSGVEALIRWRHPVSGMISPADFIPLAEDTGLIVPIGEWVIETACEQLKAWEPEIAPGLTVAINISARQFHQENLADVVGQALRVNDLAACRLDLEVTETAIMTNPERTERMLQALKGIGVRISLDDFGTGYSSLNYLKRFPIDSLKIDQSFVRGITSDPDGGAIAKLVIALGRDLGHKVIAEGVETDAQFEFLREHDCDEIQGYLFSRPLPAAEFAALMREGRRLNPGKDAAAPTYGETFHKGGKSSAAAASS